MKDDRMDRASSSCGKNMNAYRILVGKPEGKRPLGRPIARWEDNIVTCMGDYRRRLDLLTTYR
jgi:hypothetical protein